MIGLRRTKAAQPVATKAGERGAASQPPRKARRRRPQRGVLVILAALFLFSGVLRFGLQAGHAIAREQSPADMASASKEPMATCTSSDDLRATLALFKEREAAISAREAEIADRVQALNVAEGQIRGRLEELQQAEAELRSLLVIADEAAESDIARLTAVYESMKPKDAAALFEQMAPEFAAGFLGRMRPDAAAGVMTGLTPETAYTISVILAGRNANAPRK